MANENHADFTPTIPDSGVTPQKAPYVPVGSFKFWAQKVLPTVYDDSLSYYEVLTKLVWHINKMIDDMDNFNQTIDSTLSAFDATQSYANNVKNTLIETYNELQSYVNHYFDNLDVQNEINHKLDVMAQNGQLSNLLSAFIPELVTEWLEDNVKPTGSAVSLDESLSIRGSAADAHAVGFFKNYTTQLTSKNLIIDTLPATTVDVKGTIVVNNLYDQFVCQVTEGDHYHISTNDTSGVVCGFYKTKPLVGTATYNNTRTIQEDTTIQAPISGYMTVRANAGYKRVQIERGFIETDYQPPITSADEISRANIRRITNYIVQHYTPIAIDNKYITVTGQINSSDDWYITEPIDVNGCEYIRITGTLNVQPPDSQVANLVFSRYNTDLTHSLVNYHLFGNYYYTNVDELIQIPAGANYCILCNTKNKKDTISIRKYYRKVPSFDISGIMHGNYMNLITKGKNQSGISVNYDGEYMTINGSVKGDTPIWLYSSQEQFLFKNGRKYHVVYESPSNNVYLQIYANDNQTALITTNGDVDYDILIPENAVNVFVRVLLKSGSYSNVKFKLTITNADNTFSVLNISTAAQLYDFFKNPMSNTKVVLEPNTYDIYTSLAERDIYKNKTFGTATELYLHDVVIEGNGSTITFQIPKVIADAKSTICNTYSVLNVIGNVEVNDLTMIGYNCRYTLHSECSNETFCYGAIQKFTNCKFIYDTNASGLNSNAIGVGGSKGQRYIFENCSIQISSQKPAFYIHTRTYNIGELRFDNCVFYNTNKYALLLSQYTGNGKAIPVNIIDSKIGNIQLITQSGGATDNQFSIVAINSYIPEIVEDSSTHIIYTPKRINTITGVIDETHS